MIYRLLYQIALPIGALFFLPKILKKRGFKPPIKRKPKLIWVHAVSMGETVAVAGLATRLKEKFGEEVQFVISSQTATGHEQAKRLMPFADDFLLMPLDLHFVMKKYVRAAKPDLVIVSETDLWLNFLTLCKEQGAKLFLVNAKMSPSSFRLYNRFKGYANTIYGLFDHIFPQSIHYEDRFRALGLTALTTCGNLKFDAPQTAAPPKRGNDFTVTIGSTHDPEERWLLEVFESFPEIKLILVPRHPARCGEVEAILQDMRIPYGLSSEGEIGANRVLLVNEMGKLKHFYAMSDLAIVGGTFIQKVGGHNIIEPCEFGVPVLYGPHIWSQPEMHELVQEFGAGEQVELSQLQEKIRTYFTQKSHRQAAGEAGLALVKQSRGAVNRTFERLLLA